MSLFHHLTSLNLVSTSATSERQNRQASFHTLPGSLSTAEWFMLTDGQRRETACHEKFSSSTNTLNRKLQRPIRSGQIRFMWGHQDESLHVALTLAEYLFRELTGPTMYAHDKYKPYEQMEMWKTWGRFKAIVLPSHFSYPWDHILIRMRIQWIIYLFQNPCLIRHAWTLVSYQKC